MACLVFFGLVMIIYYVTIAEVDIDVVPLEWAYYVPAVFGSFHIFIAPSAISWRRVVGPTFAVVVIVAVGERAIRVGLAMFYSTSNSFLRMGLRSMLLPACKYIWYR